MSISVASSQGGLPIEFVLLVGVVAILVAIIAGLILVEIFGRTGRPNPYHPGREEIEEHWEQESEERSHINDS